MRAESTIMGATIVQKHVLAVSLGLSALAAGLQAANISDGTFSSPSIITSPGFMYNPTGGAWTFSGASGLAVQGQPSFAPWYTSALPGGSGQAAFLQNYVGSNTVFSGNPGSISQSISDLTAGDSYTLSFFAAERPSFNVNPFTVFLDGIPIGSVTPGSTTFVAYSETFTASSSTELLSFTSNAGPTTGPFDYDSILANVSLRPASVPEPGTLVLFLPVSVAVALYARRRKTKLEQQS